MKYWYKYRCRSCQLVTQQDQTELMEELNTSSKSNSWMKPKLLLSFTGIMMQRAQKGFVVGTCKQCNEYGLLDILCWSKEETHESGN